MSDRGVPQSSTSNPEAQILRFLTTCSAAMTANADGPDAERGASALAAALDRSTAIDFESVLMEAVEDTLDLVGDNSLAQDFAKLAPQLPWMPTLRASDGGRDFALSPLNKVRDLGSATVGLMYVRPTKQYPLHQHSPQELYLTISGQARWRYGGNEQFREAGPGTTLYNNPNDLHSSIAGETPLVALYVLWP